MFICFSVLFCCTTPVRVVAGPANGKGPDSPEKVKFKVDQEVEVVMKDGSVMEARVVFKKDKKNQYWLQQVGGDRQGLCHARYMRQKPGEALSTKPAPAKDHLEQIVASN